jgi:hypothetical protein
MLDIYWVKYPSTIYNPLLTTLSRHSEIRDDDADAMFDQQGIATYSTQTLKLAHQLGLTRKVNGTDIHVLSAETFGRLHLNDPGAALFDLLSQLPPFNRWLQLTKDRPASDIDYTEITTHAERDSKMRQDRPQLFDDWATEIDELCEETSFSTLQADFEHGTIHLRDEYLSHELNGIDDLPTLITLVLGTALKAPAAVNTLTLEELLDVKREAIESAIDEVLEPVGVPLLVENDLLGLSGSVDFVVENPTELVQSVGAQFDTSIQTVDELAETFAHHTNLFDYSKAPFQRAHSFTLRSTAPLPRRETDSYNSIEELVSYERSHSQDVVVTIPPAVEADTALMFAQSVEAVLTDSGTKPSISAPLRYYLRTQEHHRGALPLLEPPMYNSLTPVGDTFVDLPRADQVAAIRALSIVCNSVCRDVAATIDSEQLTINESGVDLTVIFDGKEMPLLDLLTAAGNERGVQLSVFSHGDALEQTLHYLSVVGIVDNIMQPDALALTDEFDRQLIENTHGVRELFTTSKQTLRQCASQLDTNS